MNKDLLERLMFENNDTINDILEKIYTETFDRTHGDYTGKHMDDYIQDLHECTERLQGVWETRKMLEKELRNAQRAL